MKFSKLATVVFVAVKLVACMLSSTTSGKGNALSAVENIWLPMSSGDLTQFKT